MKFKALIKPDQGRGKKMGFPTANFDLNMEIEDGIYLARAQELPALVFIGSNITFGEDRRHGETYILDFNKDLYGQEIEVEVLKKLRANKKFGSRAELVEQMKQDERQAWAFFVL